MRIVHNESEFKKSFELASEEALKAFGDDAMMVEKYIEAPRHIEVQILGDQYGKVVALFERECSIQRRYQKLIEESPSPYFLQENMHESLYSEMRNCALKLAEAVRYKGAGTVEFIVDPEENKFYFLEVNTRLQVEHPVTEAVTGIDLVKAQIRIENGESVDQIVGNSFQERSQIRGHCIEARIVAEDPGKGFLPSVGKIVGWSEPKMPGVRVDTGYQKDSEVSQYFDSLIAKVIVAANNRLEAISKLKHALKDFHVLGVKTNIEYLLDVLNHPQFVKGNIDTRFLDQEFENWQSFEEFPEHLYYLYQNASSFAVVSNLEQPGNSSSKNAWSLDDSWRITRA
jgi:acetyl/propionyl-CoA carboxylase alpha subunit